MKIKLLRIAGLGVGLAALCLASNVDTHAQQTKSNSSQVTTNWTGYLVVGKDDTTDKIAHGAHPTTLRHIEIGLRSDGVVVWRNAAFTN